MSQFARSLVLLAMAGALVTLVGSGLRWLQGRRSRLRACLLKGLGRTPDALLMGEGAGAAISFEGGLCVVAWDEGAWRIVYPLADLRGGELIIDDMIAARALPGEARRVLDQVPSAAQEVQLRLIFDDPARPHFDIRLYTADSMRREALSPSAAIAAANEWLARIDAIQRRPRLATGSSRIVEDDEEAMIKDLGSGDDPD